MSDIHLIEQVLAYIVPVTLRMGRIQTDRLIGRKNLNTLRPSFTF